MGRRSRVYGDGSRATGSRAAVFHRYRGRGNPGSAAVAVRRAQTSFYNPADIIAEAISQAGDPTRAPGKVRTLADMTPEERAALEAQYGAKVKPRP